VKRPIRQTKVRLFVLPLCVGVCFSPFALAFGAGALEQIRASSKLPGVELEKLKRGEIIDARGPLGSFPRGVYIETCYFIRAPLQIVGDKLVHWDTSKHPELDVAVLREYNSPASPNVFDPLALTSSKTTDKWLIDQTTQMLASGKPGELFVTANEAAAAHLSNQSTPDQRDTKVNDFWKKILASRDRAVATGGLSALPHFFASNIDISPRGEFDGLMKLAPKISTHFQPLLATKPLAGGEFAADEVVPYWQQTRVRGHTTLHGGFVAARKMKSWQVVDCTYFTSDTYFMSVTLYELFPIDNGTLIWQIDFVSAPFRSYLGGADRFFAGKEIVKETAKTIRLFRADVEQ
jgi:hypothetical protein